jgi:hypothetical protein
MWQLSDEVHALVEPTSIKTPEIDEQRSFIPKPGLEGVSA